MNLYFDGNAWHLLSIGNDATAEGVSKQASPEVWAAAEGHIKSHVPQGALVLSASVFLPPENAPLDVEPCGVINFTSGGDHGQVRF
jgi:hypothetical protein